MKRCLADVNVWFALAVEDHPHHRAAKLWWTENRLTVGFVRVTQLGLLRLLTTPAAMGGKPLTNTQAWSVYQALLEDDRVKVFPEPPSAEPDFRRISAVGSSAPKLWLDAYLAALAINNEATLVTFDKAFATHTRDCLILGG